MKRTIHAETLIRIIGTTFGPEFPYFGTVVDTNECERKDERTLRHGITIDGKFEVVREK